MQVSGFTIARNAVRYDYPLRESILSILPLVDEMVVAVGDSDDGTLELVQSIDSQKLHIIQTVWDAALRDGGRVLAQQTNLALEACQGDWCFYLQADEVIHENDLDRISASLRRHDQRYRIDGLSFRYHHFRADYGLRDPLPYRRQTRIVRARRGIRSVGDACGFGVQGRKLVTAHTGAWVYHYGYVKPPKTMAAKMDFFLSLYDGRDVSVGMELQAEDYDWDLRTCERFTQTHPDVMADRIAAKDWPTPHVITLPRWRNRRFWAGLIYKNSRTIRRLLSRAGSVLGSHSAA